MKFGIVAIGYNRPNSMKRLLNALSVCEYGEDEITLIVSLDRWQTEEVVQCAERFEWKYGDKIVKTFPERLGLREHILRCGGYMDEYNMDAIAVFEDDIVPSVDFYNFMRQAVPFYEMEDKIAGIALYSFQWNSIANAPFIPQRGKGSVYLSKFAASWGQIWLRKQWHQFIEWYKMADDELIEQINMPREVKNWKNSWLKYHIAYCCNQEKYFVYPYNSLTTCFSEAGAHTDTTMNRFQVPLVEESGTRYDFIRIEDIRIRYDSFFESEYLREILRKKGYDTCIDLYGLKREEKDAPFLLTTAVKQYEIVKSYGLVLKPHENNVLHEISGTDIFLMDKNKKTGQEQKRQPFNINKFLYYFNGSVDKRFFLFQIDKRIRNRFKQIFRK